MTFVVEVKQLVILVALHQCAAQLRANHSNQSCSYAIFVVWALLPAAAIGPTVP